MKKIFVLFMVLILAFTVVGCGANANKEDSNSQKQDEIGNDYFNATVLEVHADYVLVEHLDISSGLTFESTKIEVTTSNVIMENGVPELKVGDNIRIIFGTSSGIVSDKIELIVSMQLIDKDGSPISSQSGVSE